MSQLSPALADQHVPSPLVELAVALGRCVTDADIPAGTGRRYAKLAETPSYEAWLIVWPHGTGLALHDHDDSAAGVAVVRGRLRERYRLAGGLFTRWLAAGEAVALPEEHVHEMLNLDTDDAVSVHVYAPRLSAMRFHEDEHEIDLPAPGRR